MWYIIVCIPMTNNKCLKGNPKILSKILKNVWSKKTNQLYIVYRI